MFEPPFPRRFLKAEGAPATSPRTVLGFARAILTLTGGYWRGKGSGAARAQLVMLILLVFVQVGLAVRLNIWNADLFNALGQHSGEGFMEQVVIFAFLVVATMAVNATHLEVKRRMQFGWRSWVTERLLADWMTKGRHYALSLMPGDHTNPDGRIAEDIRIATEAAVELANSMFYCVLMLGTFLSILWGLSGVMTVNLPWGWGPVELPGHMVVIALIYASSGAAAAYGLGRPLVRATDSRQGREADFRFALVHARENAEALALTHTEKQERKSLATFFAAIGHIWAKQTSSLRHLTLFSAGYGTLAPILPILVTTPRYLMGAISLGGLMQTAQAFQQATAALSWPVDNAPRIAEWSASAERILALQSAIMALDGPQRPLLLCAPAPGPDLVLDNVVLRDPDGTAVSAAISARVAPGEGIVLTGDPHATSLLCRAIAGVWRWGEGCIQLPSGRYPAILVRRPWLPELPLRDLLVKPGSHSDEAISAALCQVGLFALDDRLDANEPWHRVLGDADRQRLAFAKLLLQRPHLILLDHATEALNVRATVELLGILRDALPDAMILMTGPRPEGVVDFDRRLELPQPAMEGELIH